MRCRAAAIEVTNPAATRSLSTDGQPVAAEFPLTSTCSLRLYTLTSLMLRCALASCEMFGLFRSCQRLLLRELNL